MPPRWIDPRDVSPMGPAETIVDCGATVLYGLLVPRTGHMLAIKCERIGKCERVVSLAIPETPLIVDTDVMQSNPRRAADKGDETCSTSNCG